MWQYCLAALLGKHSREAELSSLTQLAHVLLQVTTNLTTEHVKGTVREGDGKRLDEQGYSR